MAWSLKDISSSQTPVMSNRPNGRPTWKETNSCRVLMDVICGSIIAGQRTREGEKQKNASLRVEIKFVFSLLPLSPANSISFTGIRDFRALAAGDTDYSLGYGRGNDDEL